MFPPSLKHILAVLLTIPVEDKVFFVSIDHSSSNQAEHFALRVDLVFYDKFAKVVEIEVIVAEMT